MRPFPTPLTDYPVASIGLLSTLRDRLSMDPFNGIATAIFFCAIVHTFSVAWFARMAERVRAKHVGGSPSVLAEVMHFFAEVEVVFGLWAVVLGLAIAWWAGAAAASHYLNDTVNYSEALFVVVIMTIASTRPIILVAEALMRTVAAAGRASPTAWWFTILTIGPLLGSFITEPAAMAISALLLARQFYALGPSERLKYATLGLLFVNVSIGGTLTHFAAPPVLIVARVWGWDTRFMLQHFGWHAVVAIVVSNALYWTLFRRDMAALSESAARPQTEEPDEDSAGQGRPLPPVPVWITGVHMAFLAFAVMNEHYPVIVVGAFLFFLGFLRATAAYQSRVDLRAPLLVGFFLAGLVIHGGLQAWWIAPVLANLAERPLFFGATALTAINDNALITYLATLVPSFSGPLKLAVVQGAVAGGGMTVIANAPNPAGQAILARCFGGVIRPLGLAAAALLPTLIAIAAFQLL